VSSFHFSTDIKEYPEAKEAIPDTKKKDSKKAVFLWF
jgi:hypothetical protein